MSACSYLDVDGGHSFDTPTLTKLWRFLGYSDPCQVSMLPLPLSLNLGDCTVLGQSGGRVFSWGARISLGFENQDYEICALPSTMVGSTLIMTPMTCSTDVLSAGNMTISQCVSRRGGFVGTESTWERLAQQGVSGSTHETRVSNLPWPNGEESSVEVRLDRPLHLANTSTSSTVAGLVTEGQRFTSSQLGLSPWNSDSLDYLRTSGRIASRSWGLDAGSQSISNPRRGRLVLGGYSPGVRTYNFETFPMAKETFSSSSRSCPLRLSLQSVLLKTGDGAPDIELARDLDTCIEPYDNIFRFPKILLDVLRDAIRQNTGEEPTSATTVIEEGQPLSSDTNTHDYEPKTNTLHVLEPGLVYNSMHMAKVSNWSLSLALVVNQTHTLTVIVPPHEFIKPLRGLAPNGSMVLDPGLSEVAVHREPTSDGQAVLGRAFLSQVYLFVDYDGNNFSLTSVNRTAPAPVPIMNKSPAYETPTAWFEYCFWIIMIGVAAGLCISLILFLVVLPLIWMDPWHYFFMTIFPGLGIMAGPGIDAAVKNHSDNKSTGVLEGQSTG
ncbi:hypothetical protein B0H63DRAFT_462773 [Podospora didyma]|uniref:Peptidase A1 domain-containing protein n=1 Tax=Podospora didyma TaxID=330526 RepID=A0AAE0P879_9PEZI|nr:hypothetical protein B0H63DRAFT_462773 [Podospora didyma]